MRIQKQKNNWMKLMKLLGISSFIILASIFYQCNGIKNQESKICNFNSSVDSRLFIYIDSSYSTDGRCIYTIGSNYFDNDEYSSKLYFEHGRVYLQMAPSLKDFELLFSFLEGLPQENEFTIKHRNWGDGKGFDLIEKKYSAFLDKIYNVNKTKVALIRIPDIALKAPEKVSVEAYLFFSEDEAFIGSYYKSLEEPKLIISSKGNILREKIDYSDYSFYTIE